MMAPSAGSSPVVAFADREHGTWGVVLGGPEPRLVSGRLGEPTHLALTACRLERSETEDGWTCTGGGSSLRLEAAGPLSRTPGTEGAVQLYRVSGRLDTGAGEEEVDGGGSGCAVLPEGRIDSVRVVLAWFDAEEAVALHAVRPRGARGQDRDAIAVSLLGEPGDLLPFDPRLSTTYAEDGTPRRVGIELWLGESEEGDLFSRRVAAEATGAVARLRAPEAGVAAYPLRCHGRGQEGAGVYLLIQP